MSVDVEAAMVRFELVACRDRRWVHKGFVAGKNEAIEEARTLVERDPQVSAVRVLMLEDEGRGLSQRPLCTVLPKSARKLEKVHRDQPPSAGTAPRRAKHRLRTRSPRGSSWTARQLALAGLVIITGVGVLGWGLATPKQQSAFDSSDAQKPHLLRDSLTGEYSR
jgi:hypothetical protein